MGAFSILPRRDNFYTDMSALSAQAGICAKLLKSYVESADTAARQKNRQEIVNCRAQSKAIMNGVTDALGRSFITPFDREDIQNFSHNLYRIPKMIEKVTQRMELHGLSGAKDDFARQVKLIVDESNLMEELVSNLVHKSNTKKIMENVKLLHELEQKGDDVLQELLASLFTEGRDVKDLLLRKDIYDMLEKVIDCYRNAAAVVLQIVLKYS
jgi:uncharacterized protein Yka (UPF0111/DUF47 family)